MMSAVAASGVWFLALLGGIVLAGRARDRAGWMMLALGFGPVALLSSVFAPTSGWIGLLVGLIAGWRLLWKPSVKIDGASAGAMVGMAVALHLGHEVHLPVALIVAVGSLIAGLLLAGRSALTGPGGSCLAIVALAAPAIGLAPEVASGWRSVQGLSGSAAGPISAPAVMPLYVLLLIGAALIAGILRGTFRR